MKLDRFKFALLVAWIAKRCEEQLDQGDIGDLDFLTEMPDIEPAKAVANISDVNELLMQFKMANPDARAAAGHGFIPAIKAYRTITGCDLKTAKDAIEKYR